MFWIGLGNFGNGWYLSMLLGGLCWYNFQRSESCDWKIPNDSAVLAQKAEWFSASFCYQWSAPLIFVSSIGRHLVMDNKCIDCIYPAPGSNHNHYTFGGGMPLIYKPSLKPLASWGPGSRSRPLFGGLTFYGGSGGRWYWAMLWNATFFVQPRLIDKKKKRQVWGVLTIIIDMNLTLKILICKDPSFRIWVA